MTEQRAVGSTDGREGPTAFGAMSTQLKAWFCKSNSNRVCSGAADAHGGIDSVTKRMSRSHSSFLTLSHSAVTLGQTQVTRRVADPHDDEERPTYVPRTAAWARLLRTHRDNTVD